MKKWKLFLLTLALAVTAQAQNIYVWQKGVYSVYPQEGLGDMTLKENGTSIQIGTDTYATEEIDSITFAAPLLDVADKVVICYKGDQAFVTVPSNVTGLQTRVVGADVTIISSTEDTEYEYVLCGSSDDGSFYFDGFFKCKMHLNNLSLKSQTNGSAIEIECGKRIEMIMAEGSVNRLEDVSGGIHNATLYCKGHLEFEGNGELYVAGNTNHAIRSKEYTKVKRTTGRIEVTKAVKDGFHVGQYFEMNGGHVVVNNAQGDCIQVDFHDDVTKEFNGETMINGGTIDLNVCGTDVKGIKGDYNITVTGGDINIEVPGNGSKGISAGNHMTVNESSGTTDITINATGGPYTDPASNETVKCGGIKVDYNLTVDAGTITVTNTGAESYGIHVDGTYTKNGGTVNATVK